MTNPQPVHWHRAFHLSECGPGLLANGTDAHLYRIGSDDAAGAEHGSHTTDLH